LVFVKIEASVRYRQEDIDAFVAGSVIQTNRGRDEGKHSAKAG